MQIKICDSGDGKFALLGTFECGNSGYYIQRFLITKLSRKQAIEWANKLGGNK